jgi:hypothetical protein
VYEKRAVRRTLENETEKVTEAWINLHNEELYMNSLQNTIIVIKSRRMR